MNYQDITPKSSELKALENYVIAWKNFICNIMRWLWMGLLVAACSTSTGPQIEKISSAQLEDLLENSDIQLIDVRTSEEVSFGRIAGAKHIDFYDPQFSNKINSLDKEKPVVVYCAVGGRSAKATVVFKESGFQEIHDLEGGFQSWKKAGYPVEF